MSLGYIYLTHRNAIILILDLIGGKDLNYKGAVTCPHVTENNGLGCHVGTQDTTKVILSNYSNLLFFQKPYLNKFLTFP